VTPKDWPTYDAKKVSKACRSWREKGLYLRHSLENSTHYTLLVRLCNLRDEKRASCEDEIRTSDRDDSGWKPKRPIRSVGLDEGEKETGAGGERCTDNYTGQSYWVQAERAGVTYGRAISLKHNQQP
jgi:hypothetical protein